VLNRQNLPQKNVPVIVYSNHQQFIDTLYFAMAIKPRFILIGANIKYAKHQLMRFAMNILFIGFYHNEQQFKEDCFQVLNQGRVLLLYPEMGRNPEHLGDFKPLAAEVAITNNTLLIPCYIHYDKPARNCELIVGKEFSPQGYDVAHLNQLMREKILELMPKEKK
jgi:1-acyl-sn-glycerol-3-phosphate acyltransferase